MFIPAGFSKPHDIRRCADTGSVSRDFANRGGPLSILTCMITSMIHAGKADIRQSGQAGPSSAWAQTRRDRLNRLRRILQRGESTAKQPASPLPPGTPYQYQAAGSKPREIGTPGRRNTAPVVFWQALNPVERDAFRSFAFPRTFASGATLIGEGDQPDSVIVILSGRTKICVEEDGRERVLAVRGPGQLVGERGALQVSVRSASVIALETVQALVARTRDFAAFMTDHPRVLDIVERQVYERLTEDPAGYGPAALRSMPTGQAISADGTGHSLATGRPAQHPRLLNGENCTVMLSDVVGFGAASRTDKDRRIIREALYAMTHVVLEDLPDAWSWDDRGDGLLTIVLPSVPTAKVVAHLHKELPAALEEHNHAYPDSARIQLRVAINVGPVASDIMGVSGEAIIVAARLVEAPVFKKAMSDSGAILGTIASTFIYESVIRHGPYLEGYSEIRVEVKESSKVAWMKLFDRPLSSGDGA
jgi:Cyclic nucleotide-binding domain